eukprot:CAMPEP_0114527930 /NCGR_PEP_ID=MMETSP0109-20121206/23907_1 /TAXON_ID=29199 /ORGANISM="Chlorarachnion reptans, Strain CCCM449" /LENGTH=61 /DNA_ID=CAMNT_0001709985 /DNA_START=52 /DNA_END=234 /DNA_ORIENTATION=+
MTSSRSLRCSGGHQTNSPYFWLGAASADAPVFGLCAFDAAVPGAALVGQVRLMRASSVSTV